MNKITINVYELYEKAKQMYDDGMNYVEISIDAGDYSDPDCPLFPSVYFIAYTQEGPCSNIEIDYEDIKQSMLEADYEIIE